MTTPAPSASTARRELVLTVLVAIVIITALHVISDGDGGGDRSAVVVVANFVFQTLFLTMVLRCLGAVGDLVQHARRRRR